MKKITIIAALTLLGLTAYAQRQPRWGDYNLYDKVRQVLSVTKYEGANDMNFQETFDFDTAGNLKTYSRKGFGREQQMTYPLEVAADSLVRSNFDRDHDIVERTYFTPDGTLERSTHYVYSAPHKLIMTIDYEYSDEGVIVARTLTAYNSLRNIVSVHKYTPDEFMLLEEHYTYDKYDNLVKKVQMFYDEVADTQTKVVEERKYKYDRRKNWYSQQYILNGAKRYTTTRTVVYYDDARR